MRRSVSVKLLAALGAFVLAVPAAAQVDRIDPSGPPPAGKPAPASAPAAETQPVPAWESAAPPAAPAPPPAADPGAPVPAPADGREIAFQRAHADVTNQTVANKDVLSAAEGVFGKGANGLADMIEKLLKDQGQPTGYITGREAGGAFVVGLRYGSGVLTHKVEGQQPVYWTGPSVGFDVGGDAAKVFVLVYNLYDTEELYHRFPGGEGRLYFVGGFAATYLRRGNVVLVPVRLGVGFRLGANIGYMKFSEKSKWMPF